jgi:hypothetical protein
MKGVTMNKLFLLTVSSVVAGLLLVGCSESPVSVQNETTIKAEEDKILTLSEKDKILTLFYQRPLPSCNTCLPEFGLYNSEFTKRDVNSVEGSFDIIDSSFSSMVIQDIKIDFYFSLDPILDKNTDIYGGTISRVLNKDPGPVEFIKQQFILNNWKGPYWRYIIYCGEYTTASGEKHSFGAKPIVVQFNSDLTIYCKPINNDPLNFTIEITNNNNLVIPSLKDIKVRYYYSNDFKYNNADDIMGGTIEFPDISLLPYKSTSTTMKLTSTKKDMNRTLIISMVDADNKLAESNENNNYHAY